MLLAAAQDEDDEEDIDDDEEEDGVCVCVCVCVYLEMHLIEYDDTILRVVSLCAVSNSRFSLV